MIRSKKKLGIIGGMGPLAAAVFFKKIIGFTKASCDQDHIDTVMISNPEIPRRVEYILGEASESPGPVITEIALSLEKMGAEIVVMPCVTAHFFYKDISSALSVPMIDMLSETVAFLKSESVKKAGILSTKATERSGILSSALKAGGIEPVLPNEAEEEGISDIIFKEIKQGKKPDLEKLFSIMESLIKRGADRCIIGCTDLSAALDGIEDESRTGLYADMLDILARAAVRECLPYQDI